MGPDCKELSDAYRDHVQVLVEMLPLEDAPAQVPLASWTDIETTHRQHKGKYKHSTRGYSGI